VTVAAELLSLMNVVGLDTSDRNDAQNTPGRLRTLDASHRTVALRVGADVIVS